MTLPAAGRHPTLGVGLILVAGGLFAGMDTLIRHTGTLLPVLLLLTGRYLFQATMMALWLGFSRRQRFRPAHPRFQFARGALLLGSSAASFFGLQYLPVPEFTAITMLTPVLVTLLAAALLHEKVSRPRWALVGGACLGALVVIRPGSGLFGWAVLFPLAGAVCYAAFQVLTSRLAALENPYTTHFWTGTTGALLLLPVLLASPVPLGTLLPAMGPATWALLLGIGFCGSVGHLLLIFALGLAPASTLMPFLYVQLAWAAALAWLVAGHVPDGWAWVGMGIVAVCGAASAWLNLRGSRRTVTPVEVDTIT